MTHETRSSFTKFHRVELDSSFKEILANRDVEMTDASEATEDQSKRLIIAIDFGTTFSSVAYAIIPRNTPADALSLAQVRCIAKYPDDRPPPGVTFAWEPREDVPTELWYSLGLTAQQRGAGNVENQASGEESTDEDAISIASDLSSGSSTRLSENDVDEETELDPVKDGHGGADSLFWGFGVQKQLKMIDIPKDATRRLARFKLILDDKKEETTEIRTQLAPILKNLKKLKLIKKDADIFSHYLQNLFHHAKHEIRQLAEYSENMPVEFVLCVPAVWPSKACRTMQAAMSIAIQKSELGTLMNGSLDNLFIISEPEAAAACVLAEDNNDIYKDENIVILDAGGGTVDAVTYKITNSYPLRLSAELVTPGTRVCGASYLNERFAKLLLKRLKHESYLEKNGKTIQSIVEGKVIEFENGEKRIINTVDEWFESDPIYIDDLRPNSKKRFYQNRLGISHQEMRKIFRKPLGGAASALREQLEFAKAKGFSVQKVILIGGFGQSPALQAHIRGVLARERNLQDQEIHLLIPRNPSTAVARGAVLRAFNKEQGPIRKTSCSYGFLRWEPYEPTEYIAHQNTRCVKDKVDGEKYIDSTIDWLIKKDDDLPHNKETYITVKHTFPRNTKRLLCKEELYVSDNKQESHYRKTHAMNKDAELAGSIIADMTFLKDEGHIQLESPSEFSTFLGPKAPKYWSVTFNLVMIVDGRNLRYEARWPPCNKEEEGLVNQTAYAKGQTCIAAAFKPGTA